MVGEFGYRPNSLARGLRRSGNNVVGYVLPHVSSQSFGAVGRVVERILGKAGYSLLVSSADNIIINLLWGNSFTCRSEGSARLFLLCGMGERKGVVIPSIVQVCQPESATNPGSSLNPRRFVAKLAKVRNPLWLGKPKRCCGRTSRYLHGGRGFLFFYCFSV